jgi:hypothetical protein
MTTLCTLPRFNTFITSFLAQVVFTTLVVHRITSFPTSHHQSNFSSSNKLAGPRSAIRPCSFMT